MEGRRDPQVLGGGSDVIVKSMSCAGAQAIHFATFSGVFRGVRRRLAGVHHATVLSEFHTSEAHGAASLWQPLADAVATGQRYYVPIGAAQQAAKAKTTFYTSHTEAQQNRGHGGP